MRLSSHGPRARDAFRRLILESQIGVREAELAARRSRRQRFRARRVERRLAELRLLLQDLEGSERAASPSVVRSRALVRIVGLTWLAGAVLLGAELVRGGLHTTAATVGDLLMLILSVVWFAIAVARVPLSRPRGEDMSSSHPEQRG